MEEEQTYSSEQVARLFGVDNRCLQDWRLARAKGTARYLPCIPDLVDKRKVRYRLDDVQTFIEKNPRYRERVQSRLVDELHEKEAIVLLPRASQVQIEPATDYSWWLSHQNQKENTNV